MAEAVLHSEWLSGGVVRLTVDRPPVNALNPAFLAAIDRRLAEFAESLDLRAVVLTGAGKVLSAGMDLKELQDFTAEDQAAMVEGLNRTFARLYGFPRPVIAAVNGHAIAGGLFLALCSDYRIAAAGALLGLTEVRAGVRFPVGPLEIAGRELAPPVCRRLMLSGQNVSADTAAQMGIVDEVVAPDEVMARALAVAADYAAVPRETFAAVKLQLRGAVLSRLRDVNERRADPLLNEWFTGETAAAARDLLAKARR